MRHALSVFALLVMTGVAAFAQVPDIIVLGDFESNAWNHLMQDGELAKEGDFSGKWADLVNAPGLSVPGMPTDLSPYDRLIFWLHSIDLCIIACTGRSRPVLHF